MTSSLVESKGNISHNRANPTTLTRLGLRRFRFISLVSEGLWLEVLLAFSSLRSAQMSHSRHANFGRDNPVVTGNSFTS